jgi:type VI protein secretion system component VasK
MLSVLSWLIGSKVGRYLALGLLAAATVAVIVARVYSAGKRDEQLKQTQASLNAVRDKVKSDEAISRMSRADRTKRLRDEWSR